jgi:hypothetical protein
MKDNVAIILALVAVFCLGVLTGILTAITNDMGSKRPLDISTPKTAITTHLQPLAYPSQYNVDMVNGLKNCKIYAVGPDELKSLIIITCDDSTQTVPTD